MCVWSHLALHSASLRARALVWDVDVVSRRRMPELFQAAPSWSAPPKLQRGCHRIVSVSSSVEDLDFLCMHDWCEHVRNSQAHAESAAGTVAVGQLCSAPQVWINCLVPRKASARTVSRPLPSRASTPTRTQ